MSIFLQKSPSWTLRTSFLFFLSLQLKAARTPRPRREIKGNHILMCIIKLTYKSSHSKCISFMCYTESLHPFVFPVSFPFPSFLLLTPASCSLPPVSVFIQHMCGSLADQPVIGAHLDPSSSSRVAWEGLGKTHLKVVPPSLSQGVWWWSNHWTTAVPVPTLLSSSPLAPKWMPFCALCTDLGVCLQ